MPTRLIEETIGKLEFEFSDVWQVCKYDVQPFYNKIKGQGFKGVDFLALSTNSILLMEVKYVIASDENSRIRFAQNADNEKVAAIKEKLTCDENKQVKMDSNRPYLVDEVVKKVKDTLIGLFASYRCKNELSEYSQILFNNPEQVILVILFLERQGSFNQPEKFKPLASHLKLAIEQKLNCLSNVRILVVNSLTLQSESIKTVTDN